LPNHAGYAGCAGYAATIHAAVDYAATHHAVIHHAAISPAAVASHQPNTFNTLDPLHTTSAVENSIGILQCRFTGATCTIYNRTVYNYSGLASVIFFYACACAYGHRPQHTRGIHHLSDIQDTGCSTNVFILVVLPF
jgi:hypothetical protein